VASPLCPGRFALGKFVGESIESIAIPRTALEHFSDIMDVSFLRGKRPNYLNFTVVLCVVTVG